MRRIPSGQMRYYDGVHYNMSLHHVVQYCIRNPQEVGDVDLEVIETHETSTALRIRFLQPAKPESSSKYAKEHAGQRSSDERTDDWD